MRKVDGFEITDDTLQASEDTAELKMMRLLAEAVNGIAYAHRKSFKRKVGRWYRLEVVFRWPANGILDVDTLKLREVKR